ncbi:Succinate-semialdehyde dehydrogenase/glutarate-semialdehyde dehydrogenase OS=Castellaniella defragrans OX=75697 GN=HNR28_001799 PE=3 SV=1 [Castellaniella defragrans]
MKQWMNENTGGRHGHFIAGQWNTSGEPLSLHNPADKTQVLGEFTQGSAADASHALEAAQDAAASWAHVPAPQRGEILFKVANLLENAAEDMAHTVSAEQGKVLAESFGEVRRAVQELRFCAGEVSRINGLLHRPAKSPMPLC